MSDMQKRLQEQVDYVFSELNTANLPRTGIVLGTGLGDWVNNLDNRIEIPYEQIPWFPVPTVETHSGCLVYGTLYNIPLFVLQGRFHLYEGYTPEDICIGVRLLCLLGIENLILTNAAGAINPEFQEGSIMLISDHINMTGYSPLKGPNVDSWGPRFPDMSSVYDRDLQQLAINTASEQGIRLEKGVYMGVQGPNLETPAETRAYKRMGADAIGMSTALEAIVARHMNLRLLGLSCLTNKNMPDCMQETSFEEIVSRASATAKKLENLLTSRTPGIYIYRAGKKLNPGLLLFCDNVQS